MDQKSKDALIKNLTDTQSVGASILSKMTAALKIANAIVPGPVGPVPPVAALPRLYWSDEFAGSAVDATKWNVRKDGGEHNDASMNDPAQVTVASGQLLIQARPSAAGAPKPYTTGYVDTIGKLSIPRPSFTAVRAALPVKDGVSAGMWPAVWFRTATSPLEVDLMEAWGSPTPYDSSQYDDPHGRFNVAVWPDTNSQTTGAHGFALPRNGADLTQLHEYGLLLDADGSVTFYFDGSPVSFTFLKANKTYTKVTPADFPALGWDPAADSMYLRINLQVGQPSYYGLPNAQTDFSQKFAVEYVRVWTTLAP